MKDIKCPYCGKWQDIDHDDGVGYEEGVAFQQQCNECEKTFVYTTSISYYYDASKADCLNGGDHDYKITTTFPKEFSRMRCTMCDDERSLTPEEKERLLNIPTKSNP